MELLTPSAESGVPAANTRTTESSVANDQSVAEEQQDVSGSTEATPKKTKRARCFVESCRARLGLTGAYAAALASLAQEHKEEESFLGRQMAYSWCLSLQVLTAAADTSFVRSIATQMSTIVTSTTKRMDEQPCRKPTKLAVHPKWKNCRFFFYFSLPK